MFFERPENGERAILVHIDFFPEKPKERLAEFRELAYAAQVDVAGTLLGKGRSVDSRYFLSKGKLQELQTMVSNNTAEVVIFNHALSPGQERNLEKYLSCRVIDRTGVILDIFAQRARTYEGKLQVELAQLVHISTRLVRGWTHLERQKGGIGLRGPGETQLETDRRLIRGRIQAIKKRLAKVRSARMQSRSARIRNQVPTVALVGYTNAGKSTLFNCLTYANVYAEDQLFATLDPTLRKIDLAYYGPVILADTVGFIRDLPHQLIDAFKATLEEVVNADLLLLLVDASHPEHELQQEQVLAVLAEIGAKKVPKLLIYNKIDAIQPGSLPLGDRSERLNDGIDSIEAPAISHPEPAFDDVVNQSDPIQHNHIKPHIEYNAEGGIEKVYLSALQSQGLNFLFEAMRIHLGEQWQEYIVHIPSQLGRLRAIFYQEKAILTEHFDEQGWVLKVYLQPQKLKQLILDEKGVRITQEAIGERKA